MSAIAIAVGSSFRAPDIKLLNLSRVSTFDSQTDQFHVLIYSFFSRNFLS